MSIVLFEQNARRRARMKLQPSAVRSGSFRIFSGSSAGKSYVVRLVGTPQEWLAAETMRRRIDPGAAETTLHAPADADDQLVAVDVEAEEVVASCRLRTGLKAALHAGFDSARCFDLTALESIRTELIEIGPVRVAPPHRTVAVLDLLWRGIAIYAEAFKARYIMGCQSIHSADPAAAAAVWFHLAPDYLAPAELRAAPLPAWASPLQLVAEAIPPLPMLLVAALARGAYLCGPPARDPDANAPTFLTLLDLARPVSSPVMVLSGRP